MAQRYTMFQLCFSFPCSRLFPSSPPFHFLLKNSLSSPINRHFRPHRSFSSRPSSPHPSKTPVFQIWGSGTAVGKTMASTALVQRSLLDPTRHSLYIKPVQTGFPHGNDAQFVLQQNDHPNLECLTLFKFAKGISPDGAAKYENRIVDDGEILHVLDSLIGEHVAKFAERGFVLVEGAGGVLSPAPSGSLQADCYRGLWIPGLLVGDGTLGGISGTLAAYESLVVRGYDVAGIVVFEGDKSLGNVKAVERHVDRKQTVVFAVPGLPGTPGVDVEKRMLGEYFASHEVETAFDFILDHLLEWHSARRAEIAEMGRKSANVFWYPFTQHLKLQDSSITVIDSAHGSNFVTPEGLLMDGIGSWWTNGVGHGNVKLAKAIASAAGRYGHVMFANCSHAPAYNLAIHLLSTVGTPWASRVFFSDDGSTALEIAIKMAFRKRRKDKRKRSHMEPKVLSLTGAYHGDTLGAMNLAKKSVYNEQQSPWYEEKGLFLEPPIVSIIDGQWILDAHNTLFTTELAAGFNRLERVTFSDFGSIFESRESHYNTYASVLRNAIDDMLTSDAVDIGALVIEPVIQGAGGMRLIDPVFQRALVDVCRSRRIPVVVDEVFIGFYRLGCESGSKLLNIYPDIACFAKLLTGGSVPLAVTLASESVYNSFLGDSIGDALLHGHSYSAHPIGCSAALAAVSMYHEHPNYAQGDSKPAKFWDEYVAREMSSLAGVKSVTVAGTMLAVRMEGKEGYNGEGAREAVSLMKERGILCRELGSVIYIMCTPLGTPDECVPIQNTIFEVLDTLAKERPTA